MPDIIPVVPGMPAYLQQAAYTPSNLGAGIQATAPRLGITITREFTLTKGGQTQILPPAPDGRRMVRAVILAASPTLNKAWFSKPYAPGQDIVPDCYSEDAVVPAPNAEHKQSPQCAQCPKNAFGSHPVTGRGKACSDRKRLVLVMENDPKSVVVANWPTMSLPGLKNLEAQLEAGRIPLQALMVEFGFDLSVQYSKLTINPVGFVPEELFVSFKEMAGLASTLDLLRAPNFDESDAPPAGPGLVPPGYLQQPVYGPATNAQSSPTSAAPADQCNPAQAATQPGEAEKPKRHRRTKAEMEAARAAEAAAKAEALATPVQPAVQPIVTPQAQLEAAPTVAGMDPAQFAAFQAFQAFQAQQAAAAQQNALVQAQQPQAATAPVQAQLLPPEQTAAPQQTAANVLDLINKWKSQG